MNFNLHLKTEEGSSFLNFETEKNELATEMNSVTEMRKINNGGDKSISNPALDMPYLVTISISNEIENPSMANMNDCVTTSEVMYLLDAPMALSVP